jgi:excisionase family DNA binding protein
MDEKLMTVDDLAAFLQVPHDTLYQWKYRRVGPKSIKCGRHLRYRVSDVERWLDEQAARSGATD